MVRSLLQPEWSGWGCKSSLERRFADKFSRELYAKFRSLVFIPYRQRNEQRVYV